MYIYIYTYVYISLCRVPMSFTGDLCSERHRLESVITEETNAA